jgi:SnoaL-like domain
MGAPKPIDVIRDLNSYWAVRPFKLVRELMLASKDWDDAAKRFEEAGLRTDPIDPDVEVLLDVDVLQRGAWIGQTGRDQWIRFWQWWMEPWDDLKLEDADYEELGNNCVLVEMHVEATPRDSADSVELAVVQLFRVRNGLITLYGVYPNRDEALAAARD